MLDVRAKFITNQARKDNSMLPDAVKQEMEERVYKMMNGSFGSTHYCFVTVDEGEYKFHDRPDQPCIGGELRKYRETHGKDCTRPDDDRPGDLSHPFPKSGNPAGVCYHFPMTENGVEFVKLITKSDSPWIRAFGSPENISFLPVREGMSNGGDWYNEATDEYEEGDIDTSKYRAFGLTISTGDIDPTVLVNFLKHVVMANTYYVNYVEAIDEGLSSRDALVVTIFGSGYSSWNASFSESDGYMFSPFSSVRKFIRQETNDLTGGLWSQRYDYNRPDMADIFYEETPTGFIQRVNNYARDQKISHYEAAAKVIEMELS